MSSPQRATRPTSKGLVTQLSHRAVVFTQCRLPMTQGVHRMQHAVVLGSCTRLAVVLDSRTTDTFFCLDWINKGRQVCLREVMSWSTQA